jgi:putative spermidine/putrescine transport system permease protein
MKPNGLNVRSPGVNALTWASLFLPALILLIPFFASCITLWRFSFNAWSNENGMTDAWQFANYVKVLTDSFSLAVLFNTLKLGSIAAIIALVFGYPTAYAITRARHKHILILLVVVPLWMDVVIRAYGWIVLLSREGLVNRAMMELDLITRPLPFIGTSIAVVLDLLHETLPFMIITLYSVLQRLDPTLREAAMSLGANPVITFFKVTLPLSLPAMLASTILTFSLAIGAFTGPLILGAGKVPTMSIMIYQQMTFTLNWPIGAAEAVVLVLIVVALLYTYGLAMRRTSWMLG